MSSEAPILTRRDVSAELKAIHSDRHRSLHTAFYGQADAELRTNRMVQVPVEGRETEFSVKEVGSELELRRELASAGSKEPLALILTYGDRVPLDVEARIAKGGVRHIDRGRRLAARFEARTVSADLMAQKPLVDALLDLGSGIRKHAGPTVDLDAGWRALLAALTPLGGGPPSEDGILVLGATDAGGTAFAARCKAWPGLQESLQAWLEHTAGRVARLAWRAWEADSGMDAAAITFVFQACAPALTEGRHGYVRGLLASVLERIDPELKGAAGDAALLLRWGELADRVWLGLERVPGMTAEVLRRADQLLPREPEVDEALAPSPYLPRALESARCQLASALTAAASETRREAVQAALEAERRLAGHRLAQDGPGRAEQDRARMALRLLVWIHGRRSESTGAPSRPPAEQAPALAATFAGDGSFVDHARLALRGAGAGDLGQALNGVLAAADALRDSDDAAFAAALPAWVDRGRQAGEAIGIEQVLDLVAVPFLQKQVHRKLLVLLMDGMSWGRCVEILLDIEQHGFAPIVQQYGKGRLRPVLAALPTLTDVSRSAFYAGKLLKPGETASASADVQRFAGHKGLQKLGLSPRLFLGGDAVARDGAAERKALDAVRSDERVVGVVLNAVDDQLAAAGHLKVGLTLESIPALRDFLMASRYADRAVLLVADHGHVPGSRFGAPVANGDGGTRWRRLKAGDSPTAREVALGGAFAWRPPGVERVALLYVESDCYASGPREGEHGGAALAEVVAPALLIASEDLARHAEQEAIPDSDLEVRPLPRPAFWDLRLPGAITSGEAKYEKPGGAKKAPAAVSLPLPLPVGPAAPTTPVAAPAAPQVSPAVALLVRSEMFKEMLRERHRDKRDDILRAVGILAEAGGFLSPEQFATRYGALAPRVPGLVSIFSEVLNVDGYPVLTVDRVANVVRLDLAKLEAAFKE